MIVSNLCKRSFLRAADQCKISFFFVLNQMWILSTILEGGTPTITCLAHLVYGGILGFFYN